MGRRLPEAAALEPEGIHGPRARVELGVELVSHDFRRSLASYLIIAARADEGAVTGVMGHANIATTRRVYAADWREAEERNALVLRQLTEAGIGQ